MRLSKARYLLERVVQADANAARGLGPFGLWKSFDLIAGQFRCAAFLREHFGSPFGDFMYTCADKGHVLHKLAGKFGPRWSGVEAEFARYVDQLAGQVGPEHE